MRVTVLLAFTAPMIALAGCGGGTSARPCALSTDCVQGGISGFCLPSPSSTSKWCAFPDLSCPGTEEKWGVLAGDGLAEMCVAPEDAGIVDGGLDAGPDATPKPDATQAIHTLHVGRAGTGTGTVMSDVGGIDCGSTCDAMLPSGTVVTLTATPDAGSSFLGWSGACTGTGACVVTLGGDTSVTAFFEVPGMKTWLQQVGGAGIDNATATAMDAAGNVYVAGYFNQPLTFGGTMVSPAGNSDVFVAKLSGVDGSKIWIQRFGGDGPDSSSAITVDAAGNVIVAGSFSTTVSFGLTSLMSAGLADAFVAKLSGTDGTPMWAKGFGGTMIDYAKAVAVDGAGDVTVTGDFTGMATFDGVTKASSSGTQDIFLVKCSGTDGAHLWVKALGGTGIDDGLGIVADSMNNVVVTGSFQNTVNFGGSALVSMGSVDIFVAKYASAGGAHLWSQRFGDVNYDEGLAVTVDAGDNVLVTGDFQGTANFGGTPLMSDGANGDAFLVKLSAAGAHLWSKALGGPMLDKGYGVAAEADGSVLLVGSFEGTADFGAGAVSSAGGTEDIFVAKYGAAAGAHVWSQRFGSTSTDRGRGIAAGPMLVAVAGYFDGFSDFSGSALTSAGASDMFVIGLSP